MQKCNAIVEHEFKDEEDYRCMWQLRPSELPRDMPTMCIELWQTTSGRLVMFQFFLDQGDVSDGWYERVVGHAIFNHKVDA